MLLYSNTRIILFIVSALPAEQYSWELGRVGSARFVKGLPSTSIEGSGPDGLKPPEKNKI